MEAVITTYPKQRCGYLNGHLMPTKIPISLYVAAAIAVILLAPYAGCHLLTNRPASTSYEDVPVSSQSNRSSNQASDEETLVDLEHLLKE